MSLRLFPSRREMNRAQARLVFRFFLTMAVLTIAFALALCGRYLLGWW